MKTITKTITVPDRYTIDAYVKGLEQKPSYFTGLYDFVATFLDKSTGQEFSLPVNKEFIDELHKKGLKNCQVELGVKIH